MAAQYREMFEREAKEKAYPLYLNLSLKRPLGDIFDSTPYVKGNCLVNMIFHFLGESIFFSSIKRYINVYRYGAADEGDLWDVFQEEIKSTLSKELSMRNIMKNWTDHAGFPVVHVLRNNDTGLVELTQVSIKQK